MAISCGLSQCREYRELPRIPNAPVSAAACISASREAHYTLSPVTRWDRCMGESVRLVGASAGTSNDTVKQSACDNMPRRLFGTPLFSDSYALHTDLLRGNTRQPHVTNAWANSVRGPAKSSIISGATGSMGPIICFVHLSPLGLGPLPVGPHHWLKCLATQLRAPCEVDPQTRPGLVTTPHLWNPRGQSLRIH